MVEADILNGWFDGCKVRAFPWIDHETIFFHVEYYAPGSSMSKPKWEKTVYIKDNKTNRGIINSLPNTLVSAIRRMKIEEDKKYVLDFS